MKSKYKNIDSDPNMVNDPPGVYQSQHPLTFEKVWQMIQETSKMIQESDKKFKESSKEMWDAFRESREQMREASRETDKRFRETDKKIKEAFNLFTGQWGRLVESLVEGDLPRVLQERGIMVTQTVERVKSINDRAYEFDILALNGDVCVVVEVKTTLRPDDVKHFLNKLNHFREWMPRYASTDRVLGAVAYLRVDAESDRMAEKQGLFTIRATGKSAKIVNNEDFEPKTF
jgi:hypothetical protein